MNGFDQYRDGRGLAERIKRNYLSNFEFHIYLPEVEKEAGLRNDVLLRLVKSRAPNLYPHPDWRGRIQTQLGKSLREMAQNPGELIRCVGRDCHCQIGHVCSVTH